MANLITICDKELIFASKTINTTTIGQKNNKLTIQMTYLNRIQLECGFSKIYLNKIAYLYDFVIYLYQL